jgi:hypothetical protein
MCVYLIKNEMRIDLDIFIFHHTADGSGLYNIQQQDLSHPHSYRNNATSVFIQRKQLDKYIQQSQPSVHKMHQGGLYTQIRKIGLQLFSFFFLSDVHL